MKCFDCILVVKNKPLFKLLNSIVPGQLILQKFAEEKDIKLLRVYLSDIIINNELESSLNSYDPLK